jgi:7-keto-8-aminopelargonate synthetase-like enzyme
MENSARSTPFAETALGNHAQERCRKLIVAESVSSMEGDIAPVTKIVVQAERQGRVLTLDEAQ